MQRLFNAASLEGGYFNTAAVDGGAYNTAALEGGSELYDDAAVLGGFALSKLATSDTIPSTQDLINVGYTTLSSLPPTVRDTIAKMFSPQTEFDKKKIYIAIALLYLLDSLKAMAIAPEIDLKERNMARQRWIITQRYLQSLTDDIKKVYNRLLRYIHIPHHCPRNCRRMRDRWMSVINSRTRPWGRSSALRALPTMPSTKKYPQDPSWSGDYVGPPTSTVVRKRGRTATMRKRTPSTKKPRAPTYTGWDDPSSWGVDDAIPTFH